MWYKHVSVNTNCNSIDITLDTKINFYTQRRAHTKSLKISSLMALNPISEWRQ